MGPRRIAMLLMLLASHAYAQPATPTPSAALPTQGSAGKRIFLPPPVQWDNAMLNFQPALQQTQTDLSNLAGGLAFGMTPAQVNALLPKPFAGLSWSSLLLANEYPGDVRLFGVPINAAGALRMGVTACTGGGGYVAFLFTDRGLFRLSYRLVADKGCADTDEAAREIFARYVTIGPTVALSTRYRTGKTEVVDVTDTTAGYLIPIRWRQVSR